MAGRVGAVYEPEHVGHVRGASERAEFRGGGRRLRFGRGVAILPRSRGLSRRLPNRRTRGVTPPGPARLPSKRPQVPGYSRLIRAHSARPQYASSTSSASSDTKIVGIGGAGGDVRGRKNRSEEHTSELQQLMRNSYAGFCLKKKKN